MLPRVLTIAGSDSGGGAGIQADLKTIGVLGGHGMSAITAVTAQNTVGVTGIRVLDRAFVREQIETVVSDIGADAVKTGMLATAAIVDEVASVIAESRLQPLVVDPVMAAESGAGLVEDAVASSLMARMIPLATVVTPNAVEAARLLGREVACLEDQRAAAKAFVAAGAVSALIKGGHLPGAESIDVLFAAGEIHEFAAARLETKTTHGTGCTMAAAIAVYLGRGEDVPTSVARAKEFVTQAIAGGLDLGGGAGPVNQFAGFDDDRD